MISTFGVFGAVSRGVRLAGGATVLLGLLLASGQAMAQAKKKTEEPAKTKAAQPAEEPVMWVKLCEKSPVLTKDKDTKKDVRAERSICLTHHERLDGNTGMVLVSAAIRQVEGAENQHLMVMVPLGMAIQPGLKATFFSKELWTKIQKNEKVDDSKLVPINLKFSLCHPAGCTAELSLTKEVMDQLRASAGLMVYAINANGQIIAFPVPLSGFGKALDGAPVDNAKYTEERRRLMKEIGERQKLMIEEYKKKQAEKAADPAAAKAAPKPADKKK